MSYEFTFTGNCPSVELDDRVKPVPNEDRGEFVCPHCGRGLGESPSEASKTAKTHFVDIEFE